jgi:hypothetical protein
VAVNEFGIENPIWVDTADGEEPLLQCLKFISADTEWSWEVAPQHLTQVFEELARNPFVRAVLEAWLIQLLDSLLVDVGLQLDAPAVFFGFHDHWFPFFTSSSGSPTLSLDEEPVAMLCRCDVLYGLLFDFSTLKANLKQMAEAA